MFLNLFRHGLRNHRLNTNTISSSYTTATSTFPTTPAKDSNTKLILSESCAKKLNDICSNDEKNFLRVTVDGGGCSGFQYKFELDTKLNDDDISIGTNGQVVIDSVSLEYCAGSTLDYQMELIKSGFRIVNNPKAEQGCSCGASFALKIN